VIVGGEALGEDPLEIDPSSSNNAVDFPVRPRLDDLRQHGQMVRRQARCRSIRPVFEELIRFS
jgi:hypothetical protein